MRCFTSHQLEIIKTRAQKINDARTIGACYILMESFPGSMAWKMDAYNTISNSHYYKNLLDISGCPIIED